jgi:hypothetical protein
MLLERAEALEGVSVAQGPDGREVLVGGAVVAVVDAGVTLFRLRSAVATAALRTPDVSVAGRGPGWVRFAPGIVDDHARDRAVAWLDSAVRLALEADGPA